MANYHTVNKPEKIRGVKCWTNPDNGMRVMMLNFRADPDKDPMRSGIDWYEKERKGMPKQKWEKEYEIDFEAATSRLIFGSDYCDFSPTNHFIPSFDVKGSLVFSLDFGQSNPTGGLVGCYTKEGVLYIIDEYYKPAIPSISSREMFVKFHNHFGLSEAQAIAMNVDERREITDNTFQFKVIDPTTRHKNRTSKIDGEEVPYSVIEEFYDNGWDFEPGVNDVDAGITKIREMFQIGSDLKAKLYIFQDKCPSLCEEILKYRYKEQSDGQARLANSPDVPVKKDDHLVDSLRYLVFSKPFLPVDEPRQLTKIQKDIQRLMKPINVSASWDQD